MRLIVVTVALMSLAAPASAAPIIEHAFSPDRGATRLVVKTIDSARTEIRLAAYSFTSKPIASALARARLRNVDVRVAIDKRRTSERGSVVGRLRKAGVALRSCRQFSGMHNKFMVVDGTTVQTGSFNYTAAAEQKNAENVLVLHDADLATIYATEWERIWQGCRPLS